MIWHPSGSTRRYWLVIALALAKGMCFMIEIIITYDSHPVKLCAPLRFGILSVEVIHKGEGG